MILAILLLGFILGEAAAFRLPLGVKETRSLTTSLGRLSLKPGSQKRANWRIPLTGNLTYWGEYFTTVGIGSPPQYVTLQVDTGSSDLIVYSKDCNGCNASATYDQFSSSTSQQIMCDSDDYTCYVPNNDCDGTDTCAWEDQFGDGSTIDGVVVTDVLTLVGQTMQNSVSLGPIQSVDAPNGFEAFGVDGIWGLAFQELSGWQGDPAIDLLIDEYSLYNSFDLCLGENGGVLSIGDNYASNSQFVWTDIEEDIWYTIYMTDWKMGGVSLNISEYDLNYNGVIVDSGTTLLIVPYWVLNPIKAFLNNMCKTTPLVGICGVQPGKTLFDGQCFSMTPKQVSMFPPIEFAFTSISGLSITADDYLWQGAGVDGVYCLGIQDVDDTLPVILGDVFMQNYHVVFDKQQDKVGFGPLSSCPK